MEDLKINLKTVNDITDIVSTFREIYLKKMYVTKEAMWDKYNGKFPNEEKQAAYNDLCERTEYLQTLVDSLVQTCRYVAVCSAYIEKFNEGVNTYRLTDKAGNVRGALVEEQRVFLGEQISKFKKIIETYSVS